VNNCGVALNSIICPVSTNAVKSLHTRCLLHVMRHDRDRRQVFQLDQQLLDLRRADWIQRRTRFIQQQYFRLDC